MVCAVCLRPKNLCVRQSSIHVSTYVYFLLPLCEALGRTANLRFSDTRIVINSEIITGIDVDDAVDIGHGSFLTPRRNMTMFQFMSQSISFC